MRVEPEASVIRKHEWFGTYGDIMPCKSKGVPLADMCTAEVTSIAFVSTQAVANRRNNTLILPHHFSMFFAAAYPLMLGGAAYAFGQHLMYCIEGVIFCDAGTVAFGH